MGKSKNLIITESKDFKIKVDGKLYSVCPYIKLSDITEKIPNNSLVLTNGKGEMFFSWNDKNEN